MANLSRHACAMKVYAIFPMVDLYGDTEPDDRRQACITMIASMTFDSLRSGGDSLFYTTEELDPGEEMPKALGNIPRLCAVSLSSDRELMERVRRSIDPHDPAGRTIRSIATCRAATFGFDGQAFLCLRHEDEPPVSHDVSLVIVEERPDILRDYDYFDN